MASIILLRLYALATTTVVLALGLHSVVCHDEEGLHCARGSCHGRVERRARRLLGAVSTYIIDTTSGPDSGAVVVVVGRVAVCDAYSCCTYALYE